MAEDIVVVYRAEIDELRTQLNSVIAQNEKLGKSVDEVGKDFDQADKEAAQYQKRIDSLEKEIASLNKQLTTTSKKGLKDVATQANKTTVATEKLKTSVKGVGLGIAAAFSIQAIFRFTEESIKLATQLEALQTSLNFIEGSAEGGAASFEFIRKISKELGLELVSTAQAFKSFSGAARLAGLSSEQTKDVFESVAIATTALGVGSQEAERAFLALSQIISKGKVSAEELRGQLGEALPGAFSIAARSIGKTEQELNKLLETGQLISSDFLPKFAAELRNTFEEGAIAGAQSLNAEFNKLQNEVTELSNDLGTKLAPVFLSVRKFALEALDDVIDKFKFLGNIIKFTLTGDATGFVTFVSEQEKQARATERVLDIVDRQADVIFEKNTKRLQAQEKQLQEDVANRVITEQQYFEQVDKVREELAANDKRRADARSQAISDIALQTQQDIDKVISTAIARTTEGLNEVAKANILQAAQTDETVLDKILSDEDREKIKDLQRELSALDGILGTLDDNADTIADLGPTKEQIDRVKELQKLFKELGDLRLKPSNPFDAALIAQAEDGAKQIEDLVESNGISVEQARKVILAKLGIQSESFLAILIDEQLAYNKFIDDSLKKQGEAVDKGVEQIGGGLAALADSYRRELDLALQIRDQLIDVFSSLTDARITQLDRQLEAVRERNEIETEILQGQRDERLISEREFQEKQLALQQKLKDEEERIRLEKNKAARKQAIIDKSAAIFDIALNTSVGISTALRTANLVLAALIGVLGAAQTAAVIAQPVPKFAKGTKGKKDSGMALVGEEGPEMTFLPQGTKVIPARQTKQHSDVFDAIFDNRFEDYVLKNFVTPSLIAQKKDFEAQKSKDFATNIVNSIQGLSYYDLEHSRKKGMKVINAEEIGRVIADAVRTNPYLR